MQLELVSHCQDEAPKSAQEWRRDQKADASMCEGPPLPPPSSPPSPARENQTIEPEDAVEELPAPVVKDQPGVEHVGIFKQHSKVTLEGRSRKFVFKVYGSQEAAVTAAAEFRRRCVHLLGMFDGLKRAPVERRSLLENYGPWWYAQIHFFGWAVGLSPLMFFRLIYYIYFFFIYLFTYIYIFTYLRNYIYMYKINTILSAAVHVVCIVFMS